MAGEDWLAGNASRKYPIDEAASAFADDGQRLPDGFLSDVSISVPFSLGYRVGVVGASVTANGASVVLGTVAAPQPPGSPVSFQPIATASCLKTDEGKVIVLTPLIDGVSGFVTFGGRITGSEGSWNFSGNNAALCMRCVRSSPGGGNLAIGISGTTATLQGNVLLKAGPDFQIVGENRVIDGQDRRAIVIRLNSELTGRNVFEAYSGPCGGRPESGTCSRPAIETVNSLSPDCNGRVRLNFNWPLRARPFAGGGGIAVDYPYGLAEVCGAPYLPTSDGVLPETPSNNCQFAGEPSINPPPTPIYPEPFEGSSIVADCEELPVCVTFDHPRWEVVRGEYQSVGSLTPVLPICESAPAGAAWLTITPNTFSMAIWNDCGYSPTTNQRVMATMQLPIGANRTGGGLVLNFKQGDGPWDEFLFFELVPDRSMVRLRKWAGGIATVLGEAGPIVMTPGQWFLLFAELTPEGGLDTRVKCQVATYSPFPTMVVQAEIEIVTPRYGTPTGRHGIGNDRASAVFGRFGIEAWP